MTAVKKITALLLVAAVCLGLSLSGGTASRAPAELDGAFFFAENYLSACNAECTYLEKRDGNLPYAATWRDAATLLGGIVDNAAFTDEYRSQLTDNALEIYDALYENIESTKSGTFAFTASFTSDITIAEARSAFWAGTGAFYYDHPEYYWIDYSKLGGYYHGYRYDETLQASVCSGMTFSFYDENYTNYLRHPYETQEDVEADIALVNSVIEDICAIMDQKAGKYEKLKAAHDWIVVNNIYNYYVYNGTTEGVSEKIWSPASAFTSNNVAVDGPVCEAYARALKMLCDIIGIPCILVSGCVEEGNPQTSGHMWNYVKFNDKWFAIDTTWDDPGQGDYSTNNASLRYAYFLVGGSTGYGGSITFSSEHYPDSEPFILASLAYPPLNDVAFSTASDLLLATSITVSAEFTDIPTGSTISLSAAVLPTNVDNAEYTWSVVGDPSEATISADGVLTAVSEGTVTVRATSNDPGGTYGELELTISTPQDAYDFVMAKISALGDITLDKQAEIAEARSIYDALSDDAKLLVTNIAVLEAAETDLQTLIDAVLHGDLNADANINLVDLVQMRSMLAGSLTLSVYGSYAADFNGDGETNLIDLVQLRTYLAG